MSEPDDIQGSPTPDHVSIASYEDQGVAIVDKQSDFGGSLGDLSDVYTEIDDLEEFLVSATPPPPTTTSPSFFPLLEGEETNSGGGGGGGGAAVDEPFADLFDGLIITPQEAAADESTSKKAATAPLDLENNDEASLLKLSSSSPASPSEELLSMGSSSMPLSTSIEVEEKEEEVFLLNEVPPPPPPPQPMVASPLLVNVEEAPSVNIHDTRASENTLNDDDDAQGLIEEEEEEEENILEAVDDEMNINITIHPSEEQHLQPVLHHHHHHPDQISGTSLLHLAEEVETRLAAGNITTSPGLSSSSSFDATADVTAENEMYASQLLVARLASQLEQLVLENESTESTTPSKILSTTATATATASSTSTSPMKPPAAAPSSTSIGSLRAARAFISPQLEPVFKPNTSTTTSTVSPAGKAGSSPQISLPTAPNVITKYLGIVAVGSSTGAVHVLMPKPGKGKGPPHLHILEDRGTVGDATTALALGQHAGGLLLVAGHASGQLRLWETKPGSNSADRGGTSGGGIGVTWVLARSVGGVHASPVTACAVVDGGQTTWALTADAHGRLMSHSVNKLLSITAQALAGFARQWTGSGAAAAASTLVTLQAAGQDPGVVLSLEPLLASSQQQQDQHEHHHNQQQSQPLKTLFTTPDGSHFILVTASRAVLLCLLTTEGTLTILHIFFPPSGLVHGETAGCAAWHLSDADADNNGTDAFSLHHSTPSSANNRYPTPHAAVVAVAWGAAVSLYKVALSRPLSKSQPSPSSPSASPGKSPVNVAATTPLPAPLLLTTVPAGNSVCGLAFFSSGALFIATAAGEVALDIAIWHPAAFLRRSISSSPRSTRESTGGGGVVKEENDDDDDDDNTDGGLVERLRVNDWMMVRQLGIPGTSSLHSSLTGGGGDQLLLLTSRGVRVVHLLTWHQRLSTLISLGKLETALLAAVRLYFAAKINSINSAEFGMMEKKEWPADSAPSTDADEVARQLLTILTALLDSKLELLCTAFQNDESSSFVLQKESFGTTTTETTTTTTKHVVEAAEQLADVAVNACLLLSRPEALFDDIAPKFLSSPFSAAFLEHLEPRILSNELQSLAPEVMQALVEHFAEKGQLERVERCVLKLDILSLDLNQLIPLCLRQGLYGALIHIFNGALQDYQTPSALLLVAAAHASEIERSGGGGATTKIEKQSSSSLEESSFLRLGFRLLVYLRGCLLGLQYPPGSGTAPVAQQQVMRLHTVTFLLHSSVASLRDTWSLWASVAHMEHDEEGSIMGSDGFPLSLSDPSPALRFLYTMDAEAVLHVLSDGLKGWDALESDLVELNPEIGPLVVASKNNNFPSSNGGGITVTQAAVDAVVRLLEEDRHDNTHSNIAKNSQREIVGLRFVAEHLASNRAAAHGDVLLRVLRFLSGAPGAATAAADSSIVRAAHHASSSPLTQERESIFRDIVVHAIDPGAQGAAARAEALHLARTARFRQAEARIHHIQRAHSTALQCLVDDGERYPDAPFRYLRDIVFDPGMSDAERAAVKTAGLHLAPQLVRIDAAQTAATVAECFSQETQVAVLEALSPWPDDQFAFLQAAIEVGGSGGNDKRPGSAQGSSASSTTTTTTTTVVERQQSLDAFRDPLFAPLLHIKGVSSLYVRLLCRFQPASVLPFLQSHDAYDVDACLRHCIDHGARAAAAFLLERRGDIHGALKIYLEEVDGANEALMKAVHSRGTAGLLGIGPPLLTGIIGSKSEISSSSPPPPPPLKEFVAARSALHSAISMCVRFSQDRVTPSANSNRETISGGASSVRFEQQHHSIEEDLEADPVRAVWFQVLQRYVANIRQLKLDKRSIGAAEKEEKTEKEESEVELHKFEALETVFTAFMEDVVSQMAGHVPLQSMAAAVMQKYNGDAFGDFRTTLLSLLGACNFELSILRCASRVTGADTIELLKGGYQQCMRPEIVGGSSSFGSTSGGGNGVSVILENSSGGSMRSFGSAQQLGQDAWAKATAAAGPAASKLLSRMSFSHSLQ